MSDTIEATITKVAHETGTEWYSIETDHATVKKLSTKVKRAAEEAAALRIEGGPALITFTQREGRINERTGKPYQNFYLDKAERVTSSNGAAAGIDEVAPTGRKTDPTDAWRMSLAKGGELAVRTLPMMPAEARDFETQKRIAYAWARFVTETPPPSEGAPSFASTSTGRGAYDEPESVHPDFTGQPVEDDIPF